MKPVKIGNAVFGGTSLSVISGPCAAESVQMCVDVAGKISEACKNEQVDYVFKASFDKANRTSKNSKRGLGIEEGLKALSEVKAQLKVPVITDIHLPEQASEVAQVCDALQIPAFLCRQTDLIETASATQLPVMIKKGQFLAPQDMVNVVIKAKESGDGGVLVCERGSTFGYHNLVVDMRSLVVMRKTNCPVVFDATHSTQLPGAGDDVTSGEREMGPVLARAACAVGIDGLFLEAHPDPQNAISDAATQLSIEQAVALIKSAAAITKLVVQSQV